MPHPKFKIRNSPGSQFTFILTAANGQTLLISERYASRTGVEGGIESVRTNAPIASRFERREASDGRPYFVLKAGNGEIIGTSQQYSSATAMEEGIESATRNAAVAATE